LLLLAPLHVLGAGLGKLTVLSALGQPLSAEIEIVSLQAGEEDSLAARFAPNEAYRQAGIEFNSALLNVRFSIDRKAGKPVVRLVSNTPVSEPFLNVLVELSWNTGRLVREYTFLLDPPEYKGPQPISAAPAPAPAPVARPIPQAAAPAPVQAPRTLESRPIAAAPAVKTSGTYEVKKGDTLAKIATQTNPGGVSLQQMLIALYRANPDAFIDSNINRLRAGRILNVPDKDTAASVDQEDARRLVVAQGQDFRAYQSKLAGAVAAAPADSAAPGRSAGGRITAKPEEPVAESKDQVKLSKADPDGKSARSKAARADDASAREKALRESQSRVADLEKNVQDLQKLLELKNQALAELEKKGVAKSAAPAPAAPAPVAAAKPVPEPAKAAPPAPPAAPTPAPVPKPAAEAQKPAAEPPKAPEAVKPAAEAAKAPEAPKPAAEPPKPKPKMAPPPPPPPPSIVDEFLESPLSLAALGAALLGLVGYGWWAWKRKKATQSKFQDSVMGAAPAASLGSASVFSGAGAQEVDTGAAVSQASVSDASVGSLDADEVDPIAEADVYMAYGRDTQAEEILKDALAKDPSRLAIHSKLLEIYAGRRDVQNLEQTAMKIKELTGGEGEDWDKAIVLGRTADPGNVLYGGDPEATQMMMRPGPAAGAAPTLDFDLDAAAPAGGSPDIPLEADAPVAAAAGASIDFDLGGDSPAEPAAPAEEQTDFAPGGTIIMDTKEAQSASGGLDFDLGMGEPEKPAEPEPALVAPPALVADAAGSGLDFNLDLDADADKTVMMPSAPKAAEVDLSAISFDLGTPDAAAPAGEGDARWQEVATKLDLAKAYEEMGDKEGARDLLSEVAKEGDEAQKSQAQQMLAKLG
jgi:pilus assembly protein FimV